MSDYIKDTVLNKLQKYGTLASIFGLLFTLLIFYYQEGIIKTYTYTQKSEGRLTNHLHIDSEVIKKFNNLKDEEHSPKFRFISAIETAYGKALDRRFIDIIIAEAETDLQLTYNWILLPIFFTLSSAIFLLWCFISKKDEFISKKNEELNEELNEKNAKIKELTKFEHDLCLCNVKQPYATLKDTMYSMDSIITDIEHYHQFYFFGIFANKWIGNSLSIENFKAFLDKFRDGPDKGKGTREIKFLLIDPLHKDIEKEFNKTEGETNLEKYYENYRNLAEFYSEYDDIFKCKIVTYFPIFRYRKIGDETIVSDYKFQTKKIKKGEDRPHLVFEYKDKEKCGEDSTGDDKIAPCSLAAAFDAYFMKCWNDEEKAKDLLKYLEDTKEQYEKLTPQSTIN